MNFNNYAFIDSQNLNLAIRDQGWKLDFKRFRVYLKEKHKVTKAFLFIGYIKDHQKLYDFLSNVGYILIFKPVVTDKTNKVKGNVDAELVLHTMIEYPNFDKAVIVSGDGDFYCLVKYLNDNCKLHRLLIPNGKKYSRLLRPFAPNMVERINLLKGLLELKKRGN